MAKNNKNLPLRKFHKLGITELATYRQLKHKKKSIYGRLVSKTATEKNRLFEARRFALLYNPRDLDSICNLGQKRGRPLTKIDVRELIRVTDQAERKRLAQQCSKQSWSMTRLRFEIACVLPGRRYSGAPQRVPESAEGKLVVTEELLRKLIRWVNVLSAAKSDDDEAPIKQLPAILRTRLHELAEMAVKLETLCAKNRGQPAKPPSKAKRKGRR